MSHEEQKQIRKEARKTMMAMEQIDKAFEEQLANKKSVNIVYKYTLKSEYVEKTYYNIIDVAEDLMVSTPVVKKYFKHPERRNKNLITELGFTLERELL